MLKSLQKKSRSKKKVHNAMNVARWEVQAFEWALLFLQSPTKGVGERWRISPERTVERALIQYKKFLVKELGKYNISPEDIKPLETVRLSPPLNIRKKFPPSPIKSAEEKKEEELNRVRRVKGLGQDPRLDVMTATDLYTLSRFGDTGNATGI